MKLKELTKKYIDHSKSIPNVEIKNICSNSKKVKKDSLFLAIKGSKFDGHNFIDDAITKGASAIISNGANTKKLSVPNIKVKNTRIALSKIASKFYGHPSKKIKIIGITGTNGKTTTATLIKSIFDTAGLNSAQLGTLGLISNEINENFLLTTPGPLFLHKKINYLIKKNITHLVMEVSSHSLHQHRVDDINFNVGVFTNLSEEHLDYHLDMDNYLQAKSRLFNLLPKDAIAIINYDDKYGGEISKNIKSELLKISINKKTDSYFTRLSKNFNGINGICRVKNSEVKINSKLLGKFNAQNIQSAVSACIAIGIDIKSIEKGIKNCISIPGRMEVFKYKNAKIIIDYAHTPDAYEKILSTIKELNSKKGKINVLFGCGGERDESKRPIMAKIAEKYAKKLWITPDNPRNENLERINSQIIKGLAYKKYEIFNDRAIGLNNALNSLNGNDILIVLGKGRENYQILKNKKVSYSDIEIIERFINEN